MFVKSINWLDQQAEEAEVSVSDGSWECKAYSMPCSCSVGDYLKDPLFCLGATSVVKAVPSEPKLSKLQDKSRYEIVGQIVDHSNSVVCVGTLRFNVDQPFPGDLKLGDWVQFTVDRISC